MKAWNVSFAVALLTLAAWTVQAQDSTKPKVGDWVQYKQSNPLVRKDVIAKQTVKAVDEKFATITVESSIGDKEMPAKDSKVAIEEFADPTKRMSKSKSKVDKVDSGKSDIEVKNKKLACEWTTYKITPEGGKSVEVTLKVWICPDVPLGGLVKQETESGKEKLVMELIDFGFAK